MMTASDNKKSTTQLTLLNEALQGGALKQVRLLLKELRAPDIADLLEASTPRSRVILWRLLDPQREGRVLQELADEVQADIVQAMDSDEIAHIIEGLQADDIADILQQLPEQVIHEVLNAMGVQNRRRVEKILPYAEDTAGGLMNTDTTTVRPDLTLDVVLRYLRLHTELPDMTVNLYVVNRQDRFLGALPLTRLLVSDPTLTVREVMIENVEPIAAETPDSQVASLFEKFDWVSAPVVDPSGLLLGRITIDDVVDVIREDADHSLMSMAGLDEDEDTFASVRKTAPRRAIWLGINLLAVFMSANVIQLFEGTIRQVVALAILMPIVASMGGVTGSQTLTITIRGIALGQIEKHNGLWLLQRELSVALINGCLWALLAAILTAIWFNDYTIALVISIAMAINMLVGAAFGVLIPITLKKMHIDPALAGGMVLTTITDAIGFGTFLGLATLFYT
jgi:magnesium transporter